MSPAKDKLTSLPLIVKSFHIHEYWIIIFFGVVIIIRANYYNVIFMLSCWICDLKFAGSNIEGGIIMSMLLACILLHIAKSD